ncbi:MAG: hypothetical protein Pg6C_01960 [Treponemataceae bacterium]|nr:MAG: hypothetical protein Pg6C_01960 [Treponemataceae bacterium]
MKPWSKLQRDLYKIIDEKIKFQIHCVAYRMDSQRGSTNLPRYWVTLGKETVWDYPKDFVKEDGTKNYLDKKVDSYPYGSDVPDISDLLREYIETPREIIYEKHFKNDKWGLINILKSADKRIGKRRLIELKSKTHNIAANKIIEERLKENNGVRPNGT